MSGSARHGTLRWLALGAFTLGAVELACFGFAKLRPKLFSRQDEGLLKLSRVLDRYPDFLQKSYDPVVGWDNRAADRVESESCNGRRVFETTRPDRARITPPLETGSLVIALGDSYTFGKEVNDEETWPWQLSERLGMPVRNHGVPGYSPVQAALKLERLAGAYPEARVAVLAIMHKNVKRMVSRYRPAERASSGQQFGFKPYALGAQILPNPNGPTPVPVERLPELARAAFREDYFALPLPRFPYSVAMLRLLANPVFYRSIEEDRSGSLRAYYADAQIVDTLVSVVERFVAAAEAQGLRPVVAFVPRSHQDRDEPAPAVTVLRQRLGARVTVTEVGAEPGDWQRYNIDGSPDCHPSAYGHEMIATHLARVIQPLLAAADAQTAAR
jgi:hypothetical protein